MKYQKRNETLLYTAIWVILFVAPILSLYAQTLTDTAVDFDWHEVAHEWKSICGFLIVFALHNFIAAPMLVYRKRRTAYAAILCLLIAGFVAWQYSTRPAIDQPLMDKTAMHRPPMPNDGSMAPSHRGDHPTPPAPRKLPEDRRPEPPIFSGQHDIVALIVLALMLGLNVCVKYYFRFADEQKRLKDIEKQNLEHQLEYLKYQVNPHFFMNTLNNIHALVDIDPEMAKTTIVELSKMMRFVLYEADKPNVPLQKEIGFVNHYIRLMRLRYADSVRISVEVAEPMPDKMVPPLVAIAFVENAFKHGISYKHDSFVDVRFAVNGNKLLFTCRNSKVEAKEDDHGGVGLENVKRRLNLIYGERHTLKITEDNSTYNVELTVPLA